MVKNMKALLFVVAVLIVGQCGLLHAAEPVVESSDSTDRVVILNNGGVYRGELIELEPGSHLILRLATGATRRFEWRDLRRVGAGKGKAAGPRPAGDSEASGASRPRSLDAPPNSVSPPEKVRPIAGARSYREHVDDAKILEEFGQLPEALTQYELAYSRNPLPYLLYRMASLHDQLEHPREALDLYRRYQAQKPEMTEERQSELANNIARLSVIVDEPHRPRPVPRAVDAIATQTRRSSVGLMAAGISIWASSYLAAAITGGLLFAGTQSGQIQRSYSPETLAKAQATFGVLFIPVLGPFVSSMILPSAEWALPWIFLDGAAQIAGLAMTIAGGRSHRARATDANALLIMPSLSPANMGLAVGGQF